jgi:hypothetical protein
MNMLSVPSLATRLGPERFARLWRSERPFDEAFADAAGEPIDPYIRRAFVRSYGSRYHPGPWPLVAAVAVLLIVAGLCIALPFADARRPSVA